jgi:cytochrome P450
MNQFSAVKKKYYPKINLSRFSFLTLVNKRIGDSEVSWFRFGNRHHVMLSSVKTIELAGKLEKKGQLDRQAFNADYSPILGNGAFTVPQKDWEIHKREIMRYLTPTRGNDVIWQAIAHRASHRALDRWKHSRTINGVKFCRSIAQESIIEVFFGTPTAINQFKLHTITRLMLLSSEAIGFSLLFFKKHPTRFIKLPQFIGKLAGDALSRMIERAPQRPGSPAADPMFRQDIRTLMFAGHETMACALMSCLWMIGNNQALQNTLRKDIQENGSQSKLLKNTILETLRLLPPLHTPPPRVCTTDININGEAISTGSIVFFGLWQAHRRCPNAEQFNPERFNATKSERTIVPFGTGPKRCVGEQLSLVFLITVLSEILINVNINACDNKANLNPRSLVLLKELFKFESIK